MKSLLQIVLLDIFISKSCLHSLQSFFSASLIRHVLPFLTFFTKCSVVASKPEVECFLFVIVVLFVVNLYWHCFFFPIFLFILTQYFLNCLYPVRRCSCHPSTLLSGGCCLCPKWLPNFCQFTVLWQCCLFWPQIEPIPCYSQNPFKYC